MGDWNSPPVPSFTAGQPVFGSDLQTLADIATAVTAAWTTWSPTLTNLTQGSGTVIAKYRRLGKTVNFSFRFIYGAGSAVGTEPAFTLPATPAAGYVSALFDDIPIGYGRILDSGTTLRPAEVFVFSGSTATIRYVEPTNNNMVAINSTTPWTWAAGDSLVVSGTYETT